MQQAQLSAFYKHCSISFSSKFTPFSNEETKAQRGSDSCPGTAGGRGQSWDSIQSLCHRSEVLARPCPD